MTLKNHTDVLNFLIKKYNLSSYLEIGVQHGINFSAIALPEDKKVGVDPDPESKATTIMYSNEYFFLHKERFDLIFIDGSHEFPHVFTDLCNALSSLNQHGFIVMHDTVPEKEEFTLIPRQTKQWNGDVYRIAPVLNDTIGINYTTFPFDHGITVIWLTQPEPLLGNIHRSQISFKEFKEKESDILRFKTPLPDGRS